MEHSNLLKKSSFNDNNTNVFHSYDTNMNREDMFYFNNNHQNQTYKTYETHCNYTNFNSSFSNTSSGSPPQNINISEEFSYDNNILNVSPSFVNTEKSSKLLILIYFQIIKMKFIKN